MNRRIIYSRSDGGVNVVIPCRCIDDADLSDEQIYQRALCALPTDAINPKTITTADIPSNRIFRSAWEHGGDKVQVNMDRANAIHLDNIRKARDMKLAALDIETIKAVSTGDTESIETVEAQKQILRDLPQTIDLSVAKTPDELISIWPKELL